MTRSRRWWLAAAVAALVVVVPAVARGRPVDAPSSSPSQVLDEVRAADGRAFSGRVEVLGNLDLPVTSRFTDVGALLGERTSLRVWWRAADDWRVDTLQVAGESDLVRQGELTTRWRYEGTKVVRSVDPEVRLPRAADLLPPVLVGRVLRDPGAASATRIDGRRVAGVAAPGIRVVPADPRSSVEHADLWVDPGSGVVLRVDMYSAGSAVPSLTSRFTTFSAATPPPARTRFVPPAGATVTFDDVLDIADAANQYAPVDPPDRVVGLPRAGTPRGAVGVYGSGLTQVLVIPLRHRDAEALRAQFERTVGSSRSDAGVWLQSGPLGALVSEHREGSWLVVGTLTPQALVDAATELEAGATPR